MDLCLFFLLADFDLWMDGNIDQSTPNCLIPRRFPARTKLLVFDFALALVARLHSFMMTN